MSDYDSDSSCELVRVNSNPIPIEHQTCPKNTDFNLRLVENGKTLKFCYTLKEGVKLPYFPKLELQGFSSGDFSYITMT